MNSIHDVLFAASYILALIALIDACINDLRAFRIADRDWMMVFAAFVIVSILGRPLQNTAWHAAAGIAVFAGGAVLFALGAWGGGDAKLCAAFALLTGFVGLPRFLFIIALAGGIVALVAALLRGKTKDGRIPYGLAIAAGGFDWLWTGLQPYLGF